MKRNYISLATASALMFCGGSLGWAQVPATIGPNLQRFSAFGSAGVVGSAAPGTTVIGDVGGFPTCTVTNFPPSMVAPPFVNHGPGPACDGVVAAADAEATVAFNSLSQAGATAINPSLNLVDLPGAPPPGVLVPGNYTTGAAILPSNTTLTFDGAGIYVIQVASSLDVVTGPGTNMVLINGARACDIYWQVGSSANLQVQGANQVVGQIFARTAVTVTAGNVTGRTIALDAAMTMSNGGNTIGGCASTGPAPTPTPTPTPCPVITISPATAPPGTVAVAYNQTFTASGGATPYTFAVSAGALPAGLALSAGGLLSGTPSAAGSSTFTIRATDANGTCTGTLVVTIVVAPAPPPGCTAPTFTPATLRDGVLGVAYSESFTGSGGTPPHSFGVTSGALPAGVTLTAAGALSGTPTTAGTFNFTIRVTDAIGCFSERPYTVTITTPVPTLPQAFFFMLVLMLTGFGYQRLRRVPRAE